MHITLSFDLQTDDTNKRTYLRSALERYGWKRLGGSVFRYPTDNREPDWLNDVGPSVAFFRSYCLKNAITVKYFTIDASGAAFVDHSDAEALLGNQPLAGNDLNLATPTNGQSSVKALKDFADGMTTAAP